MCIDKLNQIKLEMRQIKILKFLKNSRVGVSMNDWEIDHSIEPGDFAELDPNATFYYYEGPLDGKTRPFCQEVLILSKFFSQEDLDILSMKVGYDVYLYMGSYNCRHRWVRARIKQKIKDGYVPPEANGNDLNRLKNLQRDSGLIG